MGQSTAGSVVLLSGIKIMDWGSEDKPKTWEIEGPEGKKTLTLAPDGNYYDSDGTKYAAIFFDPGYAGVSPFETGKGDPLWKAAKAHDRAFNKMLAGYNDTTKDNLKTFGKFTEDVGTEMLKAAYVLAAGPLYLIVGGLGGVARWAWLTKDRK